MSNHLQINELSFLLVEPSDTQRKIITQALHSAGIQQIEYASSIATALDCLSDFPPDLVISSMYLPDGTADNLLDQIRSNPDTEEQCFILISSERNREHLEHLRQSGALAILPKPFDMKDLQRAINATLDLIREEDIELELFEPESLRVLVTDDSKMARKHISKTLNVMGIDNILYAENGKEALEQLSLNNFDLVITDYNMPEMDGIELTETIRNHQEFSHLPILMVSSNADQSELANVAQQGVDAICGKPFEPQTIRQLLIKILNDQG
ncbi:response regulator transcription factor [Marinomonas epiphytica]